MNLYLQQINGKWFIMANGQKAAWCSEFQTKAAAQHILNKMLHCISANEAWLN